jgi:hypothetical protein
MNFHYNTRVQLVKGKGEQGYDRMIMKGIASNSGKDDDGHMLNPSGFDTSYFLQKGFINWNHEWKKNPMSIIGRPTSASINAQNELEIEYRLFKGHKTAEEVYQLAEILDKNGEYLGLSIEGEVVETDPTNKNKITKARITDCAITPHPKNSGTVTKIIKANDFSELVDFEKMGKFEVSSEGRLLVKGATTETANEVMPESLEGEPKKEIPEDEKEKKKKKISKSQVFDRLFSMNKNITLEQADKIYNYTLKFEKSKQMSTQEKTITDEALEGALEQLGLGDNGEPIEELNFSEMSQEDRNEYRDYFKKSLENIDILDAPKQEEGGTELIKAITAAIQKGNTETKTLLDEKTKALGVLSENNSDLIKSLAERIEKLESEPQGTRAVLTKGYQARPVQELGGTGKETYSVSQNKNALVTRLTDAAIEKAGSPEKIDQRLAADLIMCEASGEVAPSVVNFAKSLDIDIIA